MTRNRRPPGTAAIPDRAVGRTQILVVLLTMVAALGFGTTASAQQPLSASVDRWHFCADWSGGFSGWMSYPLSEDVGYDPSLYVDNEGPRTVLVHLFQSHGETRPQFGFIRPLKFVANAQSQFAMKYRLNTAGGLVGATLTLVASDGRLYSGPLAAAEGEHAIGMTGAELRITTATDIQAVIIRGRLREPSKNSISRWTLEKVVIDALHQPEVRLRFPTLASSPEGTNVAEEILRVGEPLKIILAESRVPTRVQLLDPTGQQIELRQSSFSGGDLNIAFNSTPGLWEACILQGHSRTRFRFLVLGVLPSHPRLWLPQARLDELKNGVQYSYLRQQIHARAKKLASSLAYNVRVGDEIDLMPSGPGIEPAFAGQMKPYVDLVTDYAEAICYNALDYELNGDQESLAAARRALLVVAEWKAWVPPRWRSHGLHTYYEVGVFTELIAFGYDLIENELAPAERTQLANAFWEKSIKPAVEEYFLYNRDPIGASNHDAHSVGGAIAAVVASARDSLVWNGREGVALAELTAAYEELLHGLFPGDGSEAEPAGYENFAMQGLTSGASALAALDVRPAGTHRMLNGFWWAYYATAWPRRVLDTGDFNGQLETASGYAWGAEHASIPELRAFYDEERKVDASKISSPVEATRVMEQMRPLDLACCSSPAKEYSAPPVSRVFSSRGSAVLRSGWDAKSTVISVRVGPWFNHEHHDEGSFQVAAFGDDLVSEAGQASYYTDPRYDDYFTQASGHNAVLIDDDPFSQAAIPGRYWRGLTYPHFTAQLMGTSFDYLSADLTSAYDGRLANYERDFFFIKPDILVVRDRLRALVPHTFSWLLHVPTGGQVQIGSAHASIQRPKASALLIAAGTNTAWKTQGVPIPINAFTNLDRNDIQQRFELVLKSPRTATTHFLVGMKLVSGDLANKVGLDPLPEQEGIKDSAGSAIVFRTRPGTLQVGTLSADADVLASRNADIWLAIGALHLREANRILLTASTPVDVEAVTRGGQMQVHVHSLTALHQLTIAFPKPSSVRLDGRAYNLVYRDDMVIVNGIPAGEHLVEIR